MWDWDRVKVLQCFRIVASSSSALKFALSSLDRILNTFILALVWRGWVTRWALLCTSVINRWSASLAFLSWNADTELLEDCRSDRWLKTFVCSFSQRLCVIWKVRVPVRGNILGIGRAACRTWTLFSHIEIQLSYEHAIWRLWEDILMSDRTFINGYLCDL